MIFSTLLLCAREDLLPLLFSSHTPRICDKDLPLSFDSPHNICFNLCPIEKELFIHNQWQVYTPFLTGIPGDGIQTDYQIPEEVSLPWATKERIGERFPGEVSFVEKVEIHPRSHDLVRENPDTVVQETYVLIQIRQEITPRSLR